MASRAALLLDPRAYKKQLQKNGNDPDLSYATPVSRNDTRPGSPHEPSHLFPSSSRCPSPPDDPVFLDPVDLLIGPAGTQNASTSPRGASSSVAPAGTVSAAHRLLNPQHRQPSSKRRSKSQSRFEPESAISEAQSSTDSSPRQVVTNEPALDVEFTSAHSDDDNDAKRSSDHLDSDVEARAGSLIEDMYGVEKRVHRPYKKIKTENDEEKSKTARTGAITRNGNTELGEYMKDDKGEPDYPSPATPNVVDLTLDPSANANDDDDLQVTGSNNLSVQKVCYGKLENAMIQAQLVPKPSPQGIFGDSAHDWPSIKLDVQRQASQNNTRINVSDPHGKLFGAVDAKTASVITPLLDSNALKVTITARLDVRRRLPGEMPWAPCSALYRASINLYGLRKDAELVGRHLGQHNVWLGTPFSVEQGVPVFNPHAERRRAQAASLLPTIAARSRSGVSFEFRTAEEVNDAVMKMFDQLQSAGNLPEMEPPSLVVTPLLRHQKQALWFMTEKEKPRKFGPNEKDNNSLWRIQYRPNGAKRYREIISGTVLDEEPPQSLGGLLADMMGLGKTLSILSLTTSSLDQAQEWAKKIPQPDLVRSLPGIRNTKTTLLVVPLSTVNNWVTQIKEHLKEGAISYYVFHGSSRTTDVDELSSYDLVITTYSIVLSELSRKSSKRGVSPLTKMNLFRIVLDEAHTIREQSAAQTQAIFKLNSERRWSVTGTPIQNRLEDLLSVTKFLGLFPYDDRARFGMHILSRFKTGDATVLASLRVLVDSFTLRRVKDKIDIPPRHDKIITLEFSEKEKQLHEFFRRESNVMMRVIAGEDKTKMKGRMYHHILKAMMILRQISAHGKELLDSEDRQRIKGISVQDAIDLEEGAGESSGVVDKKAYEMFNLMQESSADACALCGKRLEEPGSDTGAGDQNAAMAIVLPCFDVLCPDCFSGWKQAFDGQVEPTNTIKCGVCDGWIPVSYSTITANGLQEYLRDQEQAKQNRRQAKTLGEYEGPHTKTKALLAHLMESAEESKRLGSELPIKSVVFSAWTSHLDLIEIALKDNGITGYTRLDGSMTLPARNRALEDFHSNNETTILLATIGAGGVGLNLTSASKVYIMEPQYNPAAVAQAIDRVHRLGQTRDVTTVQFIMKGSIEEKIFELAKRKQQLADMSMNRGKLDKKDVQEHRMREYRSLFK
ncbi:putative SNF2 family helicase/ATPase [Aspergillus clavatus NRRL 1]|uniref:SNF2 family helicase/ATPase, putative n=1 Tax=Aspergillus clavatus (strain ATCC 1007 / CBS 513.65 / DSM 816 / NCTC 3887 / NRRL 1 / QM 1276 / 107) TaxID=344612 RepID=A1C713_ASPCL|nr:SNF2 family helicase/ATPase, putative [Aspergillus clavatus NRRL 1]EAW14184.1 SNF2 family helicase/ATPase, putative [Aspergillus clavatus NRRL 1]